MAMSLHKHPGPVASWRQFHENIRLQGWELLKRLDDFPNSILVTGCQRSGTTMLSILITYSAGMADYWFGSDSELDGALILCGYMEHIPKGRYCFQTTYLNENYREYYRHKTGHKIIWVLRNPFSVVYSMLNNWKKDALHRLFKGCGFPLLTASDKMRYGLLGAWGLGLVKQACYSYNGKIQQLFELQSNFDQSSLFVIDYDDLVAQKELALPALYKFLELTYDDKYLDKIHTKSQKKSQLLSQRKTWIIESMCKPAYEKARELLSVKFHP